MPFHNKMAVKDGCGAGNGRYRLSADRKGAGWDQSCFGISLPYKNGGCRKAGSEIYFDERASGTEKERSDMKRARILLRVSSDQQLEADGDLTIQRQIVREYVQSHSDWLLDDKEYFEGSSSGYKNAVRDRDALQEALRDAEKCEYDILAVYKDDRIGRLMWEIGAYVMTLKSCGVDIYTVKDGCISPETDDIMGQMMLALRYGNAQKSSADTGMRVKDTAQKLVQKGKFMGGCAPYGYELTLSGEISKHGRALHRLSILPGQAEVIRYIYGLSLYKEYGSCKIAKLLNEEERYRELAPKDVWKSGTITSILTNPIYTGRAAYKRREHINGKYHRLDSGEWITAAVPDERIRIIDDDTFYKTREKRKRRADQYRKVSEHKEEKVISRNDGLLPLIDVAYCGYCGRKLSSGTKYSYWTIRDTGEKRSSKTPMYRCRSAQMGIPHPKINGFPAEKMERIVFDCLSEYIGNLLEDEDAAREMKAVQNREKEEMEDEIKKIHKELEKLTHGIEVMQSHIPEAMTGAYPLSIEEIADAIHKQQKQEEKWKQLILKKEQALKEITSSNGQWKAQIPAWEQIFEAADRPVKRVLADKLIRRIDMTREQLVISFCFSP